jgi:hypothetical protein
MDTPANTHDPVADSPLQEADPNSLSELFARDPLELTQQDIKTIVAKLRASRAIWNQEEAKALASGTKLNIAATAKKAGTAMQLDFADLDIKI